MNASEANSLDELERILNNMDKALTRFNKIETLQISLLLETEQLQISK